MVVAVLVVLGAAIGLPIALSGGGNTGATTYPASIRAHFLTACETNATASKCECILSNIEGNVPLREFLAVDLAIRTGHTTYPNWLIDAVRNCATQ